jgi:ABC-type sugar transport system permease subunit
MSTSPTSHGKPALNPAPHTNRKRRRWGFCFILPTVLLLLCVIAVAVSYSLVVSLLGAPTQRNGSASLGVSHERSASTIAADFMQAVKARSYLQAYSDLDDTLLVNVTSDDFESLAAHADDCYGPVTASQLISSAVGQGIARYTYSVTRGKLSRQYPFRLTLRQSQGMWAITAFGNENTLDPPKSPPCP